MASFPARPVRIRNSSNAPAAASFPSATSCAFWRRPTLAKTARWAHCCAAKPSTPRHLTAWRRQRTQGLLSAFGSRLGRPPKDPATAELARLRLENERLTRKLAVAETSIEVQKVSTPLGITLGSPEQGGKL